MHKYCLSHIPRPGTLQFEFERIASSKLGIKDGCLAVSCDGESYINYHIDWLWRQFLASRNFR
ncbi:hypothetical protein NP274_00084 [Pseudomonas phage Kara-mokiny kep-wari Wadjak 4]|uniref:Uncharacterized protein n=3 Tax=Pbunavirus TaxID=1198980 RepID=B7VG60_9CAUD|nr:hypothetical protein PP141_gp89 [Pseudomonas phage 14-1]YP_009835215.1 hypothetical protein HWB31_gp13 [Pseudomonas phage SL1]AZV01538.1 hypothetical protein FHP_014c [Pseudomonas phage vB_PaeM_fHoPae01]QIQ66868.1 hypothetical protein jett_89 [Pseudomonas phage jett]UXD81953.1 hypothetical protein NP274_00084 [Pseudomonas phage Kara-mokiny kep-wari Wadjak 4]UXD82045.1 hypothetical protein NP274_00085 [Pseudomonas phage Kara-mokiny kep-wari Wadjak 5]UXD82078.1 hypothetical protein NP274_000